MGSRPVTASRGVLVHSHFGSAGCHTSLVEVESSVVLMQLATAKAVMRAGITVTRDLNCPCCRSAELAESLMSRRRRVPPPGPRNGNRHAIVLPVSVRRVARRLVRLARFNWRSAGQAKPAVVAQPPGKDKKEKEKDKSDEKPPEDDNIPYTFPYDRDAKNQLTAAREYLTFKDIPWNTVCPLLQNILEGKSDSFFNTYFVVNGEKKINRISVKTEANRIIAAVPEGRAAVLPAVLRRHRVRRCSTTRSQGELRPRGDLRGVAAVLPHEGRRRGDHPPRHALPRTRQLPRSRVRLRALPHPAEHRRSPHRRARCSRRASRSSAAATPGTPNCSRPHLEALRKATEQQRPGIGRRTYTFEQLRAEIDRPLDLLRTTTTVGEWAMVGGTPARAATIDGGPPFLDPIFRTLDVPGQHRGRRRGRERLDSQRTRPPVLPRQQGAPAFRCPAFFPITTPDMVMFRGYNGVYGVAHPRPGCRRPRDPRRRPALGVEDQLRPPPDGDEGRHRRHRHVQERDRLVGDLQADPGRAASSTRTR